MYISHSKSLQLFATAHTRGAYAMKILKIETHSHGRIIGANELRPAYKNRLCRIFTATIALKNK